MAVTPRMKLPFMGTDQLQKELTFNELAAMVDVLLHTSPLDKDLTAAPGSPANGDTYIIGPAPTGAWAGKTNYIAFWIGGWHYLAPQNGWLCWVQDENAYYRYNSGAWNITTVTPIDMLVALNDVDVTPGSGVDGYALTYDHASEKFIVAPVASILTALGDVDDSDLDDGRVLAWDAGESKFVFVDQTAPVVFTSLTDVPGDYTGSAGKFVAVTPDEDGLEFVDGPGEEPGGEGVTAFIELYDTPLDYTGAAGMAVVVSDDEEGVEFKDISTATGTIPGAGEVRQVLSKVSEDDYDAEWVDSVYLVPFGFTDAPEANEVMLVHAFAEDIHFYADFTGSVGYVGVNPTSNRTFTIQKNGATVGTVEIQTTGACVFASADNNPVTFEIGDGMTVIGPSVIDATLANSAITLKGRRV